MLATVQAAARSCEDPKLCLSQVLTTSEDGVATNGDSPKRWTLICSHSIKIKNQAGTESQLIMYLIMAPGLEALPARVLCHARLTQIQRFLQIIIRSGPRRQGGIPAESGNEPDPALSKRVH